MSFQKATIESELKKANMTCKPKHMNKNNVSITSRKGFLSQTEKKAHHTSKQIRFSKTLFLAVSQNYETAGMTEKVNVRLVTSHCVLTQDCISDPISPSIQNLIPISPF